MSRRSTRIATAIVPPVTKISATNSASTPTIPKIIVAAPPKKSKANADQPPAAKAKKNAIHGDKARGAEAKTEEALDAAPKKKRRVAKEKEPEPLHDGKTRCIWASNPRYPLLQQYHDTEWAVPGGVNRTNRHLFEMIILEGAQAGLSWSTVLHKREAYREAYDHFDYNLIAETYSSPSSNDRLLQTNIVKNRLKVEASMINAKAFKALLQELYPDQAQPEDENGFWQFLQDYKMAQKNKKSKKDQDDDVQGYLTSNESSDRLSADLKKRGFKFVGTTIMYSYLQAVGIELGGIHHTRDCFKHPNNV